MILRERPRTRRIFRGADNGVKSPESGSESAHLAAARRDGSYATPSLNENVTRRSSVDPNRGELDRTCLWLIDRAAHFERRAFGAVPGQFFAAPRKPGKQGKYEAEKLVYGLTIA